VERCIAPTDPAEGPAHGLLHEVALVPRALLALPRPGLQHRRSHTFRLQLAPDIPLIKADASQLQRAFVNLLGNSARYSGGHQVQVRAMALHNRIMVRVVDRGPGIPPAQQDRVFEPFYRAGTDRTGHRGSGLGLAIVRGFVEANGGRVWVESLPNQGTTFALELPLDQTADAAVPADEPTPAGSRS